MVRRLVLGYDGVGRGALPTDADDLIVRTADPDRAAALREAGVDCDAADPTDPESVPPAADVTLVASDDAEDNLAAAQAAREALPETVIIAVAPAETQPATRQALATVADRLLDPVEAVAAATLDAVDDAGAAERSRTLRRLFRRLSGPLAVVAHDNPDPDAIAAAVGLADLAERAGLAATPVHGGEINHQENRALVNALELELTELGEAGLDGYGSVALVDHARPGVNDSLPPETAIDVVVDHHPPGGPVEATFVDLVPDLGAASTLLSEYYDHLGIDPGERIATALLYGLRVDTREFAREVHHRDFEAAARLLPRADRASLKRIERPSHAPETLSVLARAIRNRDVRGTALTTCVGRIADRDALAQAAEHLLDMEGIRTTLVYGVADDTVYVSGRNRGADLDLGGLFRDALDPIGSAGGHANMAGAQLPLGVLATVDDDDEDLRSVVETVVAERVFEALATPPTPPRNDRPHQVVDDRDGDRAETAGSRPTEEPFREAAPAAIGSEWEADEGRSGESEGEADEGRSGESEGEADEGRSGESEGEEDEGRSGESEGEADEGSSGESEGEADEGRSGESEGEADEGRSGDPRAEGGDAGTAGR